VASIETPSALSSVILTSKISDPSTPTSTSQPCFALETLYRHEDEEERCGLILKDGSIVEIENVAEEKNNSYDMNPVAVLPFLEADLIAGTWHTHPRGDPNLSGEDYLGFLAYPDLEHSIIGHRSGQVFVQRYRVEKGLVIACE